MKRVFLFLGVNFAIMVVLSVTVRLLGVDAWAAQRGYFDSMGALLIYAAIFGMGGSFISLLLSKTMAKWSTGAQVIAQPRDATERWLVDTVGRLAQQSGIGMPEVAIYDAPDINAFATGATKNSSLVAVSTGLLHYMDRDEAEAVLAHEVAHVANGDMVTLALVQGVLNTFVIVLSNIIGRVVDSALNQRNDGNQGASHGAGFWVTRIVCEIVLGILASVIVAWFSRYREYRADAGSAALVGKHKMIAALQRLQQAHMPSQLPDQMVAFGIGSRGSMMQLFASHPPLEERIEALRRS
jgi:heat shock protein HtpX